MGYLVQKASVYNIYCREMKDGEPGALHGALHLSGYCQVQALQYRVCDQWNKLPAAIISSQCINTFKSNLEKYLRNMGGFKNNE